MTAELVEAPPRFATPRDRDRPTFARHTVRVAAALRIRPDPWQRTVAAVAGELDPAGGFAYPTVMLCVPRRAGKTTVAMLNSIGIVTEPGARMRRAWYTFHRREVGASLWRDEWFPIVETSKLGTHVKTRKSNGSESFTVRQTRSVLRLFAPDGEALRSQNADVVTVDEARMFSLEAGQQLIAAVGPAQSRRRRRQLWIVTNAGDVFATWARGYRDEGRAGRAGLAYFEWAAPLDGRPSDLHAAHCTCTPELLPLANPSIAHHPEIAGAIEADRLNMTADTFHAEYHGWWGDGDANVAGIDPDAWAAAADPAVELPADGFWLAVDGTPDRSSGALAGAWMDPAGNVVVELLAEGPGVGWLAAAAGELAAARGALVVIDGYGPAGNLRSELERLAGAVTVWGTSEVGRACATFHDLLTARPAGRIRHRRQVELDVAVSGAVPRRLGEIWLWDRTVTPPAVLAMTLAAAAAATAPIGGPAVARAR